MTEQQPVAEIRDTEILVDEIMARARERVRERRAQAQAQGLDYDRLVDAHPPVIAAHASPTDLEYDLQQARVGADAVLVSLEMRDRRFPLFNGLLYRLEELLHRLVVKYVNRMAGRQVVYNVAVANVITTLARQLAEREAEAQSLKQEVRELRERVAALERSRERG